MPTWKSFAEYGRALHGYEVDLTDKENQRITRLMGKEAQRIADTNVARDLGGDHAFSGWNRGAPIPLATRLATIRGGNTMFLPTRKGSGPWTVLNSGRNAGGGVGRFQGPSLNVRTGATSRTKTGAVRTGRNRRRSVRYNGTTAGKHTGERTVAEMDRRLPPIVIREVLRVARKHFDVT